MARLSNLVRAANIAQSAKSPTTAENVVNSPGRRCDDKRAVLPTVGSPFPTPFPNLIAKRDSALLSTSHLEKSRRTKIRPVVVDRSVRYAASIP